MKKIFLSITLLYLLGGLAISLPFYVGDLKTFQCETQISPNEYHTIGGKSFQNPDPTQCIRRGLTKQSILSAGTVTLIGVPILISRALYKII